MSFLWIERLLLMTVVCGTVGVVTFMGVDECIDKSVCSCDDLEHLECLCDNPNTALTIWPFTIRKQRATINLKNCGVVQLMSLSMSSIPPARLELTGNVKIVLDHSVFHTLKTMEHLVFENTSINEISSFVFHDVSGLKHLTFRKVTIGTIASHAFTSLGAIQSVSIINCDIGFIFEKAFVNITNIESFHIVDSRVHEFGSEALVVRDVKYFLLQNCTITKWGNHSITLINASNAIVRNNRVGKMADRALTTLLTSELTLSGNDIEFATTDAFDGFKDANKITIFKNRFQNVEAVSLITLFPNSLFNNSIPCNENICFLFEYGDDLQHRTPSLDRNWCLENGQSVSEYYSMMDDEDVCKLGQASGAGTTQTSQSAAGTAVGGVVNQTGSRNEGPSIRLASTVFLVTVIASSASYT